MSKYKSFLIILFIIISFSISKVYAIVTEQSLLGKSICLDAGHGGIDSGSVYKNILEKDINLELVKKIEKKLISKGANVILTRDGDYDLATSNYYRKRSDLANRAKKINESSCSIYVSIHLNSITSSKWRGLQLFYNSNNDDNKELSKIMYSVLNKNLSNVRDSKINNTYYMYKLIKKPGILIEAGFLSNASDRYLLLNDKYQDKLTNNIVKGIKKYFLNQ